MKNIRIIILAVCVACSACIWATETVTTEEFDVMYKASPATIVVDGSVGTTPFTTYTLAGSPARFYVYNSYICACLESTNATMTTGAIPDLKKVQMTYYGANDYTFSYSTDGSNWITLTHDADLSINGNRVYILPASGTYYLRVKRGGSNVYVKTMKYTTEPSCNCLRLDIQNN